MNASKNLCSYCGRVSGTNVPFPCKELTDGHWKTAICPKCFSLESIAILEKPGLGNNDFRETLVRQNKNERKRKLVGNGYMDVLFWFNEDDTIHGFQLTMREGEFEEHALTWSVDRGTHYRKVFTERRQFLTNTLQEADRFPYQKFYNDFKEYSSNMKSEYRNLVILQLENALKKHGG